jgi:hypothetical protein
MAGSPEFLRDFLAGAVRLSGAKAATVYVPDLRRRSRATLLHLGDLDPLPELLNSEVERLGSFEALSSIGAADMGGVGPSCRRERSGRGQAKSRVKRGISC